MGGRDVCQLTQRRSLSVGQLDEIESKQVVTCPKRSRDKPAFIVRDGQLARLRVVRDRHDLARGEIHEIHSHQPRLTRRREIINRIPREAGRDRPARVNPIDPVRFEVAYPQLLLLPERLPLDGDPPPVGRGEAVFHVDIGADDGLTGELHDFSPALRIPPGGDRLHERLPLRHGTRRNGENVE